MLFLLLYQRSLALFNSGELFYIAKRLSLLHPIASQTKLIVSPNLFNSVGSILRQSRFRRDPRQMDEDEEMWFNEDEDDFDNASADAKMKDCYVALKACPAQQNGPAEKKPVSEDAEKKKSSVSASATATTAAAAANATETKAVVKTVSKF